jgi:hypothetical protein
MPYKPIFEDGEYRSQGPHFEIKVPGKTIIYTYIRKNACSSFKYLIGRDPSPDVLARQAAGEKLAFSAKYAGNLRAFMVKPQTYNFAQADAVIFVWRDPFARAVSVFMNKLVDGIGATQARDGYVRLMDKAPETASFRNYLDYLDNDFAELDVHCHPQHASLMARRYTHAINMHNLHPEMTALIGAPLADKFFARRINASLTSGTQVDGLLIDKSAEALRALKASGGKISAAHFDTPELRDRVETRYAQDIRMIARITAQGS